MSTKKSGRCKKSNLSRAEQLRIAKRKSRNKLADLGEKEYSFSMREDDYYALQFLCSTFDVRPGEMMGYLINNGVEAMGKMNALKKVKDAGHTVKEIIRVRRKR